MPFFGSVIFKKTSEDEEEYQVIDGQQRITTFNILIRTLLDINEINTFGLAPSLVQRLKDSIYNIDYDDEGNEDFYLKLIPSNADKSSFEKVMDPAIDRSKIRGLLKDTPIEKAYEFFYDYFTGDGINTCKEFCLKLTSKNNSIIFIILDSRDDEQKIFDSVNNNRKGSAT